MPLLIIIGILGVWAAFTSHDNTVKKGSKPYTSQEIESLMKQMTGKSKKEARKILRQHRK